MQSFGHQTDREVCFADKLALPIGKSTCELSLWNTNCYGNSPGFSLEVEAEAALLLVEGAGHRQILAAWALQPPAPASTFVLQVGYGTIDCD